MNTSELSIKLCCQAHYGLEGTRYECVESKKTPGINLMFKPKPSKPLFTEVVDCECACHKTGETKMAKKETKKVAPKKKETKTKEPVVNKAKIAYRAGKIKVLAKENPKREGSASHTRFALYAKCPTVGEFLEKGGTQADLNWDVDKGFINFKAYDQY